MLRNLRLWRSMGKVIFRQQLCRLPFAWMTTEETKSEEEQKTGSTDYEKKFGKNKKYEKPDFLDDEYDHLTKPTQIEDDEFLPDHFMKKAPEYKRNPIAINLPWLINGAPEIDIKTRFMGDQIFSRLRVHKGEVLEHLFKIYRAVLLSAADSDYEFLREYWEETFSNKLIKRLDKLKESEIQFVVKEDFHSGDGKKAGLISKPIETEANMYDHTVIKGLSVNRKENGTEDDYIINNDIENMGFISYVPKYITLPENFSNPDKNKVIHNEAHKIIFRAYVSIKSGYKIHLIDKFGKDAFTYPDDYTWRHVAVFESQMSIPDKFTKWSLSENLMEWISKHTFGIWRLVDLDNWLVGNPLVIPKFEVKTKTYKELNL